MADRRELTTSEAVTLCNLWGEKFFTECYSKAMEEFGCAEPGPLQILAVAIGKLIPKEKL